MTITKSEVEPQLKVQAFIYCCGDAVSITTIRDGTNIDYRRILRKNKRGEEKGYLGANQSGSLIQKDFVKKLSEFRCESLANEKKENIPKSRDLYYIDDEDGIARNAALKALADMRASKEENTKKKYKEWRKFLPVKRTEAFLDSL